MASFTNIADIVKNTTRVRGSINDEVVRNNNSVFSIEGGS